MVSLSSFLYENCLCPLLSIETKLPDGMDVLVNMIFVPLLFTKRFFGLIVHYSPWQKDLLSRHGEIWAFNDAGAPRGNKKSKSDQINHKEATSLFTS